jgi:hypothetical protein
LEETIGVDEASGRFEEVEEDGVGLAAQEQKVEDLDKRWEPHGFDMLMFLRQYA